MIIRWPASQQRPGPLAFYNVTNTIGLCGISRPPDSCPPNWPLHWPTTWWYRISAIKKLLKRGHRQCIRFMAVAERGLCCILFILFWQIVDKCHRSLYSAGCHANYIRNVSDSLWQSDSRLLPTPTRNSWTLATLCSMGNILAGPADLNGCRVPN